MNLADSLSAFRPASSRTLHGDPRRGALDRRARWPAGRGSPGRQGWASPMSAREQALHRRRACALFGPQRPQPAGRSGTRAATARREPPGTGPTSRRRTRASHPASSSPALRADPSAARTGDRSPRPTWSGPRSRSPTCRGSRGRRRRPGSGTRHDERDARELAAELPSSAVKKSSGSEGASSSIATSRAETTSWRRAGRASPSAACDLDRDLEPPNGLVRISAYEATGQRRARSLAPR